MTGQTRINGVTKAPRVPVLGDWQPINIGGMPAEPQPRPEPAADPTPAAAETPRTDPVAEAEAEAIRARAHAEAEAARIAAEAEAEAVRIKAATEAEKQELANRRATMKLEADQAAHAKRVAELNAQRAAADAAAEKARQEAAADAEREATRAEEQQRSEFLWKWGARGIYLVGLVIAAPIQFLAFWDKDRPFLVAAPALLEGLALVLAAGAAWAVAHRRDVMPYRVGIMLGAMIAAGVNLWHGLYEPEIGLNAGLIGALASLGGPIVLMAYEHGIAQKADGITSYRERSAAKKEAEKAVAAREKAKAERKAADDKAAAEKAAREKAAQEEQQRKDKDRREGHEDVWKVAEAMRSAKGLGVVTDQLWGDAWYHVTGYKLVGMRAEIDEQSRAAQARAKAVAEGSMSQVESQMPHRPQRDPDAPDARRFNGGVPPLRQAGDTAPYHPAARAAAADTARQYTSQKDA